MRMKAILFVILMLAAGALVADTVQLPNPTIIDYAPEFSGTYPVGYVFDGNPNTDYASAGQGTDTFIDFDFGAPTRITEAYWGDRVTSGGPQGTFVGGTADVILAYDWIFSADSTFGNGDDVVVHVTGLPNSCCNQRVTPLNGGAGIVARYVRWDVVSISGQSNNNGASEIAFFTTVNSVPALSNWMMLLLGAGLAAVALLGVRR